MSRLRQSALTPVFGVAEASSTAVKSLLLRLGGRRIDGSNRLRTVFKRRRE